MRARATPRQARKHRRSRLSPTLDGSLSRLQPHPRPAAVLVNEPDAGRLQGERASDIGSSAGDDQKITDSPCIGDPPGDRIVVMIVSGWEAESCPQVVAHFFWVERRFASNLIWREIEALAVGLFGAVPCLRGQERVKHLIRVVRPVGRVAHPERARIATHADPPLGLRRAQPTAWENRGKVDE